MRQFSTVILTALLFFACSKELSDENANTNLNPPLGNDCRVNQVVEIDSTSGFGSISRFVQFNQDGQAIGARFYDSINNTVFDETTISYRGDTMRIGSDEYFLLDGTKRVKSSVSLIDTGNLADTMFVRYSYDGAGYLTRRELFIDNETLPRFWYTYVWRNGDLVESEGFYRDISGPVRISYAEMQYDQSVNVKGYLIPIHEGWEVNRFLSALNLGRLPQHLHTRTVITVFDLANQSQLTYVNRLRSHEITSDGYIQAYTSYMEATPIDPADSFRVRLGYFCR